MTALAMASYFDLLRTELVKNYSRWSTLIFLMELFKLSEETPPADLFTTDQEELGARWFSLFQIRMHLSEYSDFVKRTKGFDISQQSTSGSSAAISSSTTFNVESYKTLKNYVNKVSHARQFTDAIAIQCITSGTLEHNELTKFTILGATRYCAETFASDESMHPLIIQVIISLISDVKKRPRRGSRKPRRLRHLRQHYPWASRW